mmetsp:Transcript_11737/g.20418  ORF Transcript_11737/g.20418 Transcript_11737/m.20418 type:complete len:276 (-) Transcript_11737:386-1213(-)
MNQSQSTPSRALHLRMLTLSLALFSPSHAFQCIHPSPTLPSSLQPTTPTSSTTALHASRKGNRGPKNKKPISDQNLKRNRPQISDVLDGITSPPTFPHSVDPTDVPAGTVNDDPLAPLVHTIVHAADMRKATDIVALRVTPCTSLTNFVIIVSGTSRPQNQAIANAIAKDVEEFEENQRPLGNGVPEGSADSGWILLDYGEVMVHVMTPKSRLFYDMEGQWRERGGEYMDLSGVLVDEMGVVGGGGVFGGVEEEEEEMTMKERLDVEKESDPFWS